MSDKKHRGSLSQKTDACVIVAFSNYVNIMGLYIFKFEIAH